MVHYHMTYYTPGRRTGLKIESVLPDVLGKRGVERVARRGRLVRVILLKFGRHLRQSNIKVVRLREHIRKKRLSFGHCPKVALTPPPFF